MSSFKGSRSSKSTTSRLSEMERNMVQAAQKKAELQLRMEAMQKEHNIKLAYLELEKERERITLETELAIEEAKLSIFEKVEDKRDRASWRGEPEPVSQADKHQAVQKWLLLDSVGVQGEHDGDGGRRHEPESPSEEAERQELMQRYRKEDSFGQRDSNPSQTRHLLGSWRQEPESPSPLADKQESAQKYFYVDSVGDRGEHVGDSYQDKPPGRIHESESASQRINYRPIPTDSKTDHDYSHSSQNRHVDIGKPEPKPVSYQTEQQESMQKYLKATTYQANKPESMQQYLQVNNKSEHDSNLYQSRHQHASSWKDQPVPVSHTAKEEALQKRWQTGSEDYVYNGDPNIHQYKQMGATSVSPNPWGMNPVGLQTNQTGVIIKSLADMLLEQQRMATLPKRTIEKFDGDPIKYATFTQAFKCTVEQKTSDDIDRLYFLEQYTTGEPNKLVRGLLNRGPSGYEEAKRLLKRKFGDKYVIADAFIKKAEKWPDVKREDRQAWSRFSMFLVEYQNSIMDLGCINEVDHSGVIKMLLTKIPYSTRNQWRIHIDKLLENEDRMAGFQDFVEFIEKQTRIVSNPLYGQIEATEKPKLNNRTQKTRGISFATSVKNQANVNSNKESDSTKSSCSYCDKNSHSLENCWSLQKLPIKDRIKYLRKINACFGCLKVAKHTSKDCKSRLKCNKCQRRHPTVLHDDQKTNKPAGSTESQSADQHNTENSHTNTVCGLTGAGDKGSEYFPVILPVKVKAKDSGKEILTYAFIDDGSNSVFCSENLQRKLNTKGIKTKLRIETLNKTADVNSIVLENLAISDVNNENTIDLPEVFTQTKIPASKDNIVRQHDINSWNYLQKVSLHAIDTPDTEIGILIGNNVPQAMEPLEVINSEGQGPFAIRTRLGWTVHGVKNKEPRHSAIINRIDVKQREDMHQDLVNMYNMEFSERLVDDTPQKSRADKCFMEMLSESTTVVDGHYQVGLPLESKDIIFPNNRPLAEQRAAHLKRRFIKDEAFKEEYTTVMNQMIDKGYAEIVPQESKHRNDGKVWYIPHHGVHHPRKGKLRVVYDCAATYKSVSLNKKLLQGPNLTNNLVGVLLRFQKEPVALMADIEAMYHQVKVPVNERDMLRFLWWTNGDVNSPLVEYRMAVHLFGSVSSPACAMYALQKVADEAEDHVGEVIRENFYVDDLLCSTGSQSSAINLANDLTKACKKGGFNLTKWVSNHRDVLKSIPETERAKDIMNVNLGQDQLPTERALGMLWNVETDSFGYKLEIKQHPHTRRGILSCVSSMYDPLGFISPALLPAKLIMQELCRMQLGWDDQIPVDFMIRWRDWLQDIPKLSSFNVPRCFRPFNFGESVETQLHHFCDASESAYGTVSYLRMVNSEGEVHCQIVFGKARVTPLKQISIPRLELTAATVAVRVDNLIKRELKIEVDSTWFWTDSTTVLRYLNNRNTRFHTFVANRIAIITEATEPKQWRYVPSAQNPADECSRGMKVENLLKSSRWIGGPDFLYGPESQWPRNIVDKTNIDLLDDPEVKKKTVAAVHAEESKDSLDRLIEHYSSWHRLKRAVAWFMKIKQQLLERCRKKLQVTACQDGVNEDENIHCHTQIITLEDLNAAEDEIIRHIQRQAFPDEIKALSRNNQAKNEIPTQGVKKSSDIYRLDPQLDNGILRVGGRLRRSALPEETKHPAILPKQSRVSEIILQQIHQSAGHCGRNYMIAISRKRFWIVNVNSAARSIIHNCIKCKKQKGKVSSQKMADLPLDRLVPDDPPFTYVGMDFFGPLEVKRGRSLEKRYGVIFTCLAIRAVHIEMAYSLTTDSCISAIRRFLSRRGQVKLIRSDNGSNIVGAQRELQREINKWNQNVICNTLQQRNIEWQFNPPGASHFGGVWERQIRSIRKVMLSIMKEQTLTDESLSTLLCEIESIINGRPITKPSEDMNDLEGITPNHLLLLKGKPSIPPTMTDPKDQYVNRRWRQVQYLADVFWRRWILEYLPLLQERQKWNESRTNLKVGDVVLLADNTAPRNTWKMGRILATHPDELGHVRSVDVKTKSGVYTRPISKLIFLLESDSQ